MKKNKLNTIIKHTDENTFEQFMENNSSLAKITTNFEKIEFDYSWLEKIEFTLPYIDEIVRKPKKFIVQEEEIVGVERCKKVTLETIRHLAQHTNFIQEIKEDGTITPSKVLNVHKEESFDMYENRFIYSLLCNLEDFFQRRKKVTAGGAFSKVEKVMQYSGETNIGLEKIKVNVNLEAKSFEDLSLKSDSGLSVDERADKIQMIINDFLKSPLITEIQMAGGLMVKSPIRKTNVILKNPNFQKALELWEFIEHYDINNKTESRESNDFEDEGKIKEEMDFSFLVDYAVLSNASIKKDVKATKIRKYYISKLINDFVDKNEDMNEVSFRKIIIDEFKEVRSERDKENKAIYMTIDKAYNNYMLDRNNLFDQIKVK